MKKILVAASLALSFAALASEHQVVMKSISFEPKVLEVKVGDSVVWANKSYTPHSATSNDKNFDTGMIDPQTKTKSVQFSTVGTFDYHCAMHGLSMSGQIVVKP